MIHRVSWFEERSVFLGQHAVCRISLFDSLPQLQLDGGVGLGNVGAVRFSIDARAVAKMPHRDSVGGVGELEGKRRELLTFAQDRILSPAGSKSGSRATVAGTQRSKTWTWALVPGAACADGR